MPQSGRGWNQAIKTQRGGAIFPIDPLRKIAAHKVPDLHYPVPNPQVGGFLPFLAALIFASVKAATPGGATALGGLAVNKLLDKK